ncbi:MAG: hypothetical protein QF474_03480 [SAR324 cluster bacterium]|nr:hypothetical protein [SAR324 cluster bacterium]
MLSIGSRTARAIKPTAPPRIIIKAGCKSVVSASSRELTSSYIRSATFSSSSSTRAASSPIETT